jgi:hypothetical protein
VEFALPNAVLRSSPNKTKTLGFDGIIQFFLSGIGLGLI